MHLAEITTREMRSLMAYGGLWVAGFGLLMLTVAFTFECVRETALNTRWQVPPESRPRRRYYIALVLAGLLALAGVLLVIFGVAMIFANR